MRHRLDGLRISEAGFATDAYAITSTVLKRPPAPPQLLSGGPHGVTNDWKVRNRDRRRCDDLFN